MYASTHTARTPWPPSGRAGARWNGARLHALSRASTARRPPRPRGLVGALPYRGSLNVPTPAGWVVAFRRDEDPGTHESRLRARRSGARAVADVAALGRPGPRSRRSPSRPSRTLPGGRFRGRRPSAWTASTSTHTRRRASAWADGCTVSRACPRESSSRPPSGRRSHVHDRLCAAGREDHALLAPAHRARWRALARSPRRGYE